MGIKSPVAKNKRKKKMINNLTLFLATFNLLSIIVMVKAIYTGSIITTLLCVVLIILMQAIVLIKSNVIIIASLLMIIYFGAIVILFCFMILFLGNTNNKPAAKSMLTLFFLLLLMVLMHIKLIINNYLGGYASLIGKSQESTNKFTKKKVIWELANKKIESKYSEMSVISEIIYGELYLILGIIMVVLGLILILILLIIINPKKS